MSFVQIVYCHKHHVGQCNRHSNTDFIMFDEQGFPWCPKHFPRDRKTNLGTPYKLPDGYADKSKAKLKDLIQANDVAAIHARYGPDISYSAWKVLKRYIHSKYDEKKAHRLLIKVINFPKVRDVNTYSLQRTPSKNPNYHSFFSDVLGMYYVWHKK